MPIANIPSFPYRARVVLTAAILGAFIICTRLCSSTTSVSSLVFFISFSVLVLALVCFFLAPTEKSEFDGVFENQDSYSERAIDVGDLEDTPHGPVVSIC